MNTQAQVAAADLARAIRKFADTQNNDVRLEEYASVFDDLGTIRLEGDYDVLVAQKLRTVTDLFRSGTLGRSYADGTLGCKLRELEAEVREALLGTRI
jgi:hypothetical protein